MDATFRSCPRPYRQCFTILGNHHGFVLPLVHVLMEHRTIGHDRQVLQAVKVAIRRVTHHNWRPQLVVYNFENSLKTALETDFPQAMVGGCYFHFNQSLWRKIQELRLAVPYNQDCTLAQVICKLMTLGYLPLALVQVNFKTLVNGRRCRRLVRHYAAMEEFITYVTNTYIHPGSTFPPVMWNVLERDMDQRTNNHVKYVCEPCSSCLLCCYWCPWPSQSSSQWLASSSWACLCTRTPGTLGKASLSL
ncbi:uncharacterized protein LOC126385240 [Epinephelus moara]|uniref:uncharacterized protein LOC126385240 n=1 Tax=Epinephelus moara TaxID=300413 RepID=UPI00214E3829|nr:uncharacterized protein LOC126385240 [Epinephelus moara]